MSIKTASSQNTSIVDAVKEIQAQLGDFKPKLVLFFASSSFNPDTVSAEMQKAYPASVVAGCTTAGEITSGKMLKNSIVAMSFSATTLHDAKAVVLQKISEGNPVPAAMKVFESYYDELVLYMEQRKYVGIILVDGLSGSEEKLMDSIGNLTNVSFIGGSAGDDAQFKTTYVYAGGKAYTDAAVLLLLKPCGEFGIIKTQSFCPLDKTLVATKVDEASREVLEFNNKPALDAYAEAIGKSTDEAKTRFMHNPVGLMADEEPYVRSPQQAIGDKIRFYCNIKEGMELSVLESTNIIEDTRNAINDKINVLHKISGIINFNCILRALELEEKGLSDEYAQIFSDIPTVGFNTYGEEYIGHINQTATMLVFK